MPTFKLNKIIRDGFRKIYADIGQIAKYKKITTKQHKELMISKIIEEVSEIPVDGSIEDITNELADVQQAIDDFKKLCGISGQKVKKVQKIIFDKKGGFVGATYIETLQLQDDDPWVEYYRKKPDIFPED